MLKTPIDYQKSIIYKICCKDLSITDCYVGSTTNLSRRKPAHKTVCNNERNKDYNMNVYQFIRSHGGWENWDIIVVEGFPCESKNELHTRERFHMELLNSTLNSNIPCRTQKWFEDNSEYIRAQHKQWYENNLEHMRARCKQYYEENAEHIKAQKDNEEKRKARDAEKIPCPRCNKILSRSSMTVHIRRKHTE